MSGVWSSLGEYDALSPLKTIGNVRVLCGVIALCTAVAWLFVELWLSSWIYEFRAAAATGTVLYAAITMVSTIRSRKNYSIGRPHGVAQCSIIDVVTAAPLIASKAPILVKVAGIAPGVLSSLAPLIRTMGLNSHSYQLPGLVSTQVISVVSSVGLWPVGLMRDPPQWLEYYVYSAILLDVVQMLTVFVVHYTKRLPGVQGGAIVVNLPFCSKMTIREVSKGYAPMILTIDRTKDHVEACSSKLAGTRLGRRLCGRYLPSEHSAPLSIVKYSEVHSDITREFNVLSTSPAPILNSMLGDGYMHYPLHSTSWAYQPPSLSLMIDVGLYPVVSTVSMLSLVGSREDRRSHTPAPWNQTGHGAYALSYTQVRDDSGQWVGGHGLGEALNSLPPSSGLWLDRIAFTQGLSDGVDWGALGLIPYRSLPVLVAVPHDDIGYETWCAIEGVEPLPGLDGSVIDFRPMMRAWPVAERIVGLNSRGLVVSPTSLARLKGSASTIGVWREAHGPGDYKSADWIKTVSVVNTIGEERGPAHRVVQNSELADSDLSIPAKLAGFKAFWQADITNPLDRTTMLVGTMDGVNVRDYKSVMAHARGVIRGTPLINTVTSTTIPSDSYRKNCINGDCVIPVPEAPYVLLSHLALISGSSLRVTGTGSKAVREYRLGWRYSGRRTVRGSNYMVFSRRLPGAPYIDVSLCRRAGLVKHEHFRYRKTIQSENSPTSGSSFADEIMNREGIDRHAFKLLAQLIAPVWTTLSLKGYNPTAGNTPIAHHLDDAVDHNLSKLPYYTRLRLRTLKGWKTHQGSSSTLYKRRRSSSTASSEYSHKQTTTPFPAFVRDECLCTVTAVLSVRESLRIDMGVAPLPTNIVRISRVGSRYVVSFLWDTLLPDAHPIRHRRCWTSVSIRHIPRHKLESSRKAPSLGWNGMAFPTGLMYSIARSAGLLTHPREWRPSEAGRVVMVDEDEVDKYKLWDFEDGFTMVKTVRDGGWTRDVLMVRVTIPWDRHVEMWGID